MRSIIEAAWDNRELLSQTETINAINSIIADIDKGLEIYLKNGQKKDEDADIKKSLSYMYS